LLLTCQLPYQLIFKAHLVGQENNIGQGKSTRDGGFRQSRAGRPVSADPPGQGGERGQSRSDPTSLSVRRGMQGFSP